MKIIPVLYTKSVDWGDPKWSDPIGLYEWVYYISKPTDFIHSDRKFKRTFLYQYDFGFIEAQEHIRDCEAYLDQTYTERVRYLALGYTPV